MSQANSPRFPSKVDWWLGLLLAILPLVSLTAAVLSLMHGAGASGGGWAGASGIVLVGAIYGGLVFPMYYEVAPDALVVRFGLARTRIAYADIKSVVPTRDLLSSPALSLDRLHIDYGTGLGVNISPADKAGFLRAVADRAPQLEIHGAELRSRASAS